MGQHARNVVVGDVDDEGEEKDQANLDEALFEGEAEIAAAKSFEDEKDDVATIEDGDGEKIEDAEIDADEGHETDDSVGALGDGLSGGAGDADNALQLLDGDAAADKFADNANGLGDKRSRSV